MDRPRPSPRAMPRSLRFALAGAVGAAAGLGAAAALLLGPVGGAVGDANDRPSVDPSRLIDATHVPPLLTLPGEPVTLRYDIYCPPPDGSATDECDAAGDVYVRPGDAGAFRRLPLSLDKHADEGRWAARVPGAIARAPDGLTYYAILRNRATGASLTLPAGGPAAPQRSYPVAAPIAVELGTHAFGRTRGASGRPFSALWGDGPGDAGLEDGSRVDPIGPSSFAVTGDGTVTVLDQVHHRGLVHDPGAAAPRSLPLAVNGTIADLARARDGTLWVLETAGPGAPLLREFAADGAAREAVPLADRTASQVRLSSTGPVVKEESSEEWAPAVEGGSALSRRAQRVAAVPLRAASGGPQVAVLRVGDEVRVALVGPAGVERAWRVHSTTPLAEVQLAEPYGDGVLVVVRMYTDSRDEFVAARLGPRGVESTFSVAAADWAETAPLSRFRLAGSSLYQLGSTPAGVFVDRFDLEVR